MVILIVTCVDYDRGMVAEPLDILGCFALDRLEEIGPGRIVSTGKSEVLPDKDTKLVTSIVEDIFFINTTSPYAVEQLINVEALSGIGKCIRTEP